MATHNSLFSADDVRRLPDGSGIAVSVQLPWYRSLLALGRRRRRGDGERRARAEGPDPLRAGGPLLHGRRAARAVGDPLVRGRPARCRRALDEVPAPGESITVEVVLTMRLLYMQIAPQRYVTNRVPVEREVVLA